MLEKPGTTLFSPTNTNMVQAYDDEQGFLPYFDDGVNYPVVDMWRVFDSVAQVYNALYLETQISYTDCDNGGSIMNFMPGHKQKLANAENFKRSDMPNYSRVDGQRLMKLCQAKAKNYMRTRSGSVLNYILANQQITGTSQKYLEFDVTVDDNIAGVYFNNGLVNIRYSSKTFGQNVVSHGNIAVTRGTVISSPTDYNAPIPIDLDSVTIAIPITCDTAPHSLIDLPSTATKLIHVKLKLKSCNNSTLVSLTNNINVTAVSLYDSIPNPKQSTPSTPLYNYGTVNFTGNFKMPACTPHITSFSPAKVSAGIGDSVIINGLGFGNLRGTGGVFLVNANNPKINIKLDSLDIMQWTDTFIKFKVPSVADTVGSIGNYQGCAGTGPIIVQTNNGDSTQIDTLNVFYAVANAYYHKGSYKSKVFVDLIDQWRKSGSTDHFGYWLKVDTSISSHRNNVLHDNRMGCLLKAVHDWQCLTHVNIQVDTSRYIALRKYPFMDSICTIAVGNAGGYSALANTIQSDAVYRTSPRYVIVAGEFDLILNQNRINQIVFDTSATYSIPAGKFDGYKILLHEIGHGISLYHVNDTSKIMYWATMPGFTTSTSRRIDLTKDAAAYYGESNVLNKSYADSFLYKKDPLTFPMRFITKCTSLHAYGNSVANISSINKWVNVYPNPTNGYLTINLNHFINGSSIIEIHNVSGAEVYIQTMKIHNENCQINMENLPAGIYILTLKNNTFCTSFKIIKQ